MTTHLDIPAVSLCVLVPYQQVLDKMSVTVYHRAFAKYPRVSGFFGLPWNTVTYKWKRYGGLATFRPVSNVLHFVSQKEKPHSQTNINHTVWHSRQHMEKTSRWPILLENTETDCSKALEARQQWSHQQQYLILFALDFGTDYLWVFCDFSIGIGHSLKRNRSNITFTLRN